MKYLRPFNESASIDYANDIFNTIRDEHPDIEITLMAERSPYFVLSSLSLDQGFRKEIPREIFDEILLVNKRLINGDLLRKDTTMKGIEFKGVTYNSFNKNINEYDKNHDIVNVVYFYIKKY